MHWQKKKIKQNNDFLQVHEIGKELYVLVKLSKSLLKMNTMEHTERWNRKTTVGTTLEKVTYTMFCSLSQSKQYVYGVLYIGDHPDSSATLLCLSKSDIYIFDPHGVSMKEEPVSNGTSALLHSFQEQKW